MKTAKIILVILSLLGIGFLAGFFTHRYVSLQRIHRVAEMRMARGFQENLFRMIEATEEQRAQLEPIVEEYAREIGLLHRDLRAQRRVLIDSMHQEIKPLLTEAQIQRLENFSRRFRPPHPHRDRKMKKRAPRREKMEQ